jgi:hypothetical protein
LPRHRSAPITCLAGPIKSRHKPELFEPGRTARHAAYQTLLSPESSDLCGSSPRIRRPLAHSSSGGRGERLRMGRVWSGQRARQRLGHVGTRADPAKRDARREIQSGARHSHTTHIRVFVRACMRFRADVRRWAGYRGGGGDSGKMLRAGDYAVADRVPRAPTPLGGAASPSPQAPSLAAAAAPPPHAPAPPAAVVSTRHVPRHIRSGNRDQSRGVALSHARHRHGRHPHMHALSRRRQAGKGRGEGLVVFKKGVAPK